MKTKSKRIPVAAPNLPDLEDEPAGKFTLDDHPGTARLAELIGWDKVKKLAGQSVDGGPSKKTS